MWATRERIRTMKDQIQNATGEELSRLAGEVLQSDATDHDYGKSMYVHKKCLKCEKLMFDDGGHATEDSYSPCSIPDPIPLDDWNVAMKYFKAVENKDTLELTPKELTIDDWFKSQIETPEELAVIALLGPRSFAMTAEIYLLHNGEPKAFLVIAAQCKLNKENK